MAAGPGFNSSKFKELVLYLSEASAADEGFGMVKLNKLLYRADFEAYRLLGQSITGETYIKQEFGPVAADLPIALDELASRGYIRWQHLQRGDYTSDVPAAIESPDTGSFSAQELGIIDRTVEELSEHGGASVSAWSHMTSVGWQVAELSEPIPYETALLSSEPLPEEMLAKLRSFDTAA